MTGLFVALYPIVLDVYWPAFLFLPAMWLGKVELTGHERLRFPISLPSAPIGSAGPAVVVQAGGEDWVLPTDQAAVLADLLNRRIAATR